MITRMLFWRSFLRDKIFIFLVTTSIITLILALTERRPAIERSPVPFTLGLFFIGSNYIFSILTHRREPLLSYLFLTATILLNGTLYFFFRYLLTIQLS